MKLSQSYRIITDHEVMKLIGPSFFNSKVLDVSPIMMLKDKRIIWEVTNKENANGK